MYSYYMLSNASISNVKAYPSGGLHKANNYSSLFNTPYVTNGANVAGGCMCYDYSKNYYYRPHSGYGSVGRTAAGYLGQRRRL
jgi:hypothetical protein